jgi:hypothetical protein
MIKFFRKIRKELFVENRFNKYLLYAIGEIVLVVIGILIALQINNWNEEKKERITEKKILKELLVDLEISKADLENDIDVNKKNLKKTEIIKNHIYLKKKKNDSVEGLLVAASVITQFTPRNSGYQNLQSVGLSIISNDALRKEITNVFERNFEYSRLIGRDFDKIENSSIDLYPFFLKHFMMDVDNKFEYSFEDKFKHPTPSIKIRDYQALLNDKDFIFTLQKTIYDRASKLIDYYRTINKIDKVSNMIKEELKTINND